MNGFVLVKREKKSKWAERYMYLHHNVLYLFRKVDDTTPHRTIVLKPYQVTISEITLSKKVYEIPRSFLRRKNSSRHSHSPSSNEYDSALGGVDGDTNSLASNRDGSTNISLNNGNDSDTASYKTVGLTNSLVEPKSKFWTFRIIFNTNKSEGQKEGKIREAYLEMGVSTSELAEVWKETIEAVLATYNDNDYPKEKKYGITPAPIQHVLKQYVSKTSAVRHSITNKLSHHSDNNSNKMNTSLSDTDAANSPGIRASSFTSLTEGKVLDDRCSVTGGSDEKKNGQDPFCKYFDNWYTLKVADGITVQVDDPCLQTNFLIKAAKDYHLLKRISFGAFPLFVVLARLCNSLSLAFLGVVIVSFLLFEMCEEEIYLPLDTTLRSSKVVEARTDEVASVLLNDQLSIWSNSITMSKVVQHLDEHTTIYRIIYRPNRVWRFWTQPRDACVMRYWRREEDGSYMLIIQSVTHPGCPPFPGFVRATLSGTAILVNPETPSSNVAKSYSREKSSRSLVSIMIRYDPEGWKIPFFYYHRPVEYILPQLSDCIAINDFMVKKKFESRAERNEEEFAEALVSVDDRGMVVGVKRYPCSVEEKYYGEPVSSKFPVRGEKYLEDGLKFPSAPAPFHLVALENWSFEDPSERKAICKRPDNLVYKLNSEDREDGKKPPYTFVVNFIVPCRDNLSVSCYFQPTSENWETDNPAFAELFDDFIDGDNAFRNNRFKLVPVIVEGNFVIKKAVNRPAIIGNKGVLVHYTRGDNWFEVDIDVDSDRTARQLTGMAIGATKSLVVDIGFLIESQTADELPECILGACQFRKTDLSKFRRIPKGLYPDDADNNINNVNK